MCKLPNVPWQGPNDYMFHQDDGIGFGAGSRIRTDDLEITNHPLYQLSYSGVNFLQIYNIFGNKQEFVPEMYNFFVKIS